MPDFYFRYNFVPVTGKIGDAETPTVPYYKYQARHDVWDKDRHTGKITVKLTTVTPTIVGNSHTPPKSENDPATINQYTWDNQVALPANSIKGMISTIAETLSQSALRVLDTKYKPAFQKISEINKLSNNLTPWSSNRSELTPAELLFGVVDDGEGNNDDQSNNLASRLRFSDATLLAITPPSNVIVPCQISGEPTLKILSSPKADGNITEDNVNADIYALSLYFVNKAKKRDVSHLQVAEAVDKGKRDIDAFNEVNPNGRKYYLLHNAHGSDNYKNDADTEENRVKCKLIEEGTEFSFTIKFNNLSKAELTLLKQSISPHEDYIHGIGLGKSLGLGAIQLEIESIHEKDIIKTAYSKSLIKEPIYKEVDIADDYSLIDKDSRNKLIHIRDQKIAPDSENIRERDGYQDNEMTISMPALKNVKDYSFKIEESNQTKEDFPRTAAAKWLQMAKKGKLKQ